MTDATDSHAGEAEELPDGGDSPEPARALVCPSCGVSLNETTICPQCGLSVLSERAANLSEVNRDIIRAREDFQRIDTELRSLRDRDASLRTDHANATLRHQNLEAKRRSLVELYEKSPNSRPAALGSGTSPQSGVTGEGDQQPSAQTETPPPHPGSQPSPPRSAPSKTVQNLLLTVGGVLLGVAAIAFTAFAWSNFGIGGRAAILSGLTVLALAIPAFLVRKSLNATAETIATLALLLIALDGYSAWFAQLGDVNTYMDGYVYSGLVSTVVAIVGAVYAKLVPLRGPQIVAVIAAHAAVPLYALGPSDDPLLLSLVCLAVVAADIAIVAASRQRRFLAAVASLGGVLAGILSLGTGLWVLSQGESTARVLASGGILLALAGLIVVAGAIGNAIASQQAAVSAIVLVWITASALAGQLSTSENTFSAWVVTAAVIPLLAACVVAFASQRWRVGGSIGVALTSLPAGAVAFVHVMIALSVPISYLRVSEPVGHGWGSSSFVVDGSIHRPDMAPALAGVLTVAGLGVLLFVVAAQRSVAFGWMFVAGVPAALAVFTAFPLSFRSAAVVESATAVLLFLLALWVRQSAGAFVAVGLAAHGVLFATSNRVMTLAVVGGFVVVFALLSVVSRRQKLMSEVAFMATLVAGGSEVVAVGAWFDLEAWAIAQLLLAYGLVLTGLAWLLGKRSAIPPWEQTPAQIVANRKPQYAPIAEWTAVLAVVVAVYIVMGSALHLALTFTTAGLVAGVAALRADRRFLAWVAISAEVFAVWFWLAAADVRTMEAYTLPLAIGALAIGLVTQIRRPTTSSWVTFGPGLAAAFLPTYMVVLNSEETVVRPLALIVTATAVMILGALTNRQAPFVIGAVTLLATGWRIVLPIWPEIATFIPVWVPLALAGALLVALGATWERRRRDLAALGAKVRAMR